MTDPARPVHDAGTMSSEEDEGPEGRGDDEGNMIGGTRAPTRKARVRPMQQKVPEIPSMHVARAYKGLADIDQVDDPDMDPGDFNKVPEWVLEAEKLYITRKLTTQRNVATHFDVPEGTVVAWSTRRRWTERRRRAEDEAARKLADRIDQEAAQALVDQFAGMDQDVIVTGQMAARLCRMHTNDELKRASEASTEGKKYVATTPNKEWATFIRMSMDLRPKVRVDATSDELGDVLNPRDADDEEEDEQELEAEDGLD